MFPLDLPDVQDTPNVNTPVYSPVFPLDLPETRDSSVLSASADKPVISADLPDIQDIQAVNVPHISGDIEPNLPDIQDSTAVNVPPVSASLIPELPQTSDTTVLRVDDNKPVLLPELPDTEDSTAVNIPVVSAPLATELPEAGDAIVLNPEIQRPAISPDLIDVDDAPIVGIPSFSPKLPPDLPQIADDGNDLRKELSFNGRWLPKGDPLNIGAENYETLENIRYTDFGLEGVGGTTRINPTTVGTKLTNGIQLKTNYTKPSYVLCQVSNTTVIQNTATVPGAANFPFAAFSVTSGSNDKLNLTSTYSGTTTATVTLTIPDSNYSTGAALAGTIQEIINLDGTLTHSSNLSFAVTYGTSTHKFSIVCTGGTQKFIYSGSTIGSTIGFTEDSTNSATITSDTAITTDTALYTEESDASQGRFSHLPSGNVGFCDQKANKIWAGDEMPVAACLITKSATVDSTTLGVIATNGVRDRTVEMNNTLTDDNNIVVLYNNTTFGDATTVYAVTVSYPYTILSRTSGTTPNFVTNGLKTNANVIIGAPFDATQNMGTFSTHSCTETVLTLNNKNGKAETVTSGASSVKSSDKSMILIGSTRKLSSVKFTVNVANTFASSMTTYFTNGFAFVSMTVTDGTKPGSITLAQSGTISWPTLITDGTGGIDDVYVERPIYIGGYYLYFYLFVPSACNAKITQITENAGIQNYSNMWDGVARTCIMAYVYKVTGTYHYEFTLEVEDQSPAATPLGLALGGLTTSEYAIVIFGERCTGLEITMGNATYNDAAATATVQYWNGITFESVGNIIDRTLDSGGTKSLSNSGKITWGYIEPIYEKKYTFRGVTGYAYKLKWSAQLNNSPAAMSTVIIDMLKGITSHEPMTNLYTFPFQYRNRSMLCGCVSDGEKNRVDYSPTNSPDVYNGDESSKHDNSQSLYFGGYEPLTSAVELFNLYGDSVSSNALFLKNNETFLLTGDSPSNFKIYHISKITGNPAPLTLDVAEVSVGSQASSTQNVAVWLSDKGPVMFYNNTILPMPGIEPYFEDGNPLCINKTYIATARGCYGPEYKSYNLYLPSAAATTATNDLWFAFDFQRLKWYQITPTIDFPQGAFPVEDTYGNKYLYGYTETGYLLRLEADVQYWSTSDYHITGVVKTADILPTGSTWDTTLLRRIKTLFVCDTTGEITITHYLDGAATGTVVSNTVSGGAVTATYNTMAAATAGDRYRNLITKIYKTVSSVKYGATGLSHAIKFSIANQTEKPKLLGWGMQYLPLYEDTSDETSGN